MFIIVCVQKHYGLLSDDGVLEHISRSRHARTSFKNLVRELGAKGEDRQRVEEILERLTERGELIELRGGQYAVARLSREFLLGRLQMHKDGFGFVVPDNRPENMRGDLFIPPDEAAKAMHGDRVIARVVRIESDGRADGAIVRILKRAHMTVVGEFNVRRHGCFVKPHDDRIKQWIEIAEGMEIPESRATINRVGVEPKPIHAIEDMDGMIVNVEILEFGEEGENAVGKVIEVLGAPDDFGVDVEIIIRKFHIPHEFPEDVIRQAREVSEEIPAEEIARRQDFRTLDIVTIDGETARDFDDAVWVDRLDNGNYALQVHIADVSYYVGPGSPIDREATKRGTSVYFPDRAVPMLPVELSTGICSLKPQVDRLVMSAILEIDNSGAVVSQEFTRGVIRSAERMTYTNVHLLLEGDAAVRERYARLVDRFELMKELALKLNRKRVKRGSIDFDLPEPIIEFDTQGDMIGVVRSPRNIAHRIIEEFMLAANEAVASHLEAAEIDSIYRVHEPPDPKRILDFEEVASKFGYSLNAGPLPVKKFRSTDRRRDGRKATKEIVLPDEKITIPSRAYQKLTAKLEGKPEERILTYLMLRSLKQAKYREENLGHYALAAESYTHFTSPIRRYPDLMVHRILGEYMDRHTTSLNQGQLRVIAEDCSQTERRADEAERELVEWKKAKFMEQRVGEDFDALVISTTKYGLFVELEQFFIEGLVPIDSLPGDRYLYNENTRKIVGNRSRREFSIGDRVHVVLDRVDAIERKLTFSLMEAEAPQRKRKRR
ncbi:MAG TPA: VacB/RNase II family 3'-5' exoribonuclease [Bryobacteraceae bacterium]|nr:VacB/RNase II family 3'-5' exoribonuclease [Bryobacteraceae bacterium]